MKLVKVTILALAFGLVFNCGQKDVKSAAECKPVIEKVLADISSKLEESQKAQFEALKAGAYENMEKSCRSGKLDLECLKNAKDLTATMACAQK